jgi:hypothetical protein
MVDAQHIRDGYIHVNQQKTCVKLDIPIMPELEWIKHDVPGNGVRETLHAGRVRQLVQGAMQRSCLIARGAALHQRVPIKSAYNTGNREGEKAPSG